jgi:hypothetical protein
MLHQCLSSEKKAAAGSILVTKHGTAYQYKD